MPREKIWTWRKGCAHGLASFNISQPCFESSRKSDSRKSTGSITSAWLPHPRIQLSKSGATPTCIVNSIPAWPIGRISCDLCHWRSETSRAAKAIKTNPNPLRLASLERRKAARKHFGDGKIWRPFERNLQLFHAIDACQSEGAKLPSRLVARDQIPLVVDASEVIRRRAATLRFPCAKGKIVKLHQLAGHHGLRQRFEDIDLT